MDGWITIGTKIDNNKFDKQVKELESKIESTEKKQEILNQKTNQYENELKEVSREVEKISNEYENASQKAEEFAQIMKSSKQGSFVNYQATEEYNKQVEIVDKLATNLSKAEDKQTKISTKVANSKLQYENTVKSVDTLKNKLNEIQTKKAQNEAQQLQKRIKETGNATTNVVKKIGKWAVSIFGVRAAYSALRSASSILGQYDKQYATNLEYIRFALAQTIAPVLRYIVDMAQKLLSYINYLAQAWFKINIFANASAKKFAGASKSTKEMAKNLAGFDELNVLGSANNQEENDMIMPSFDLANIDDIEIPQWLQWLADNGDIVAGVIIAIGTAIVGLKLYKLISDLGSIFSTLSLTFDKLSLMKALGIGVAIYGIYKTIKSLMDYMKDPTWTKFGEIIQGIGIIIIGVGIAIGSIPAIVVGVCVFILGIILQYWEEIKAFLQRGIDWLKDKSDWVHEHLGGVAGSIYDAFVNILQVLLDTFDTIFTSLRGIFDGIILFIKGVFTGDWEMAWEGVKKIFSSIWDGIVGIVKGAINIVISLINGMIGALETSLNWIVDKVNSLEIVNPFNGEEIWSPSLPRFSFGRIPMLAKGGIINQPTRAVIGEAGKEAVLPLENNTEWMDILADKIGGNRGGEITINFTGSTAQLVRMLKPELDRERSRVGARIITGGRINGRLE